MMQKSFYEAPESELLLVRFERNIMSLEGGNPNKPFGAPARYYGFEEEEENY